MDSEQLRWALLIIGTVLIIVVYLYGRHQTQLRNRAALKTYTQDELDEPYIDDDTLRQELKHLDDVLADDDAKGNFREISINPGIEAEYSSQIDEQNFINAQCETKNHLVSYLLKRSDGTTLSRDEAHKGLIENNFKQDGDVYLFLEKINKKKKKLFSVVLHQNAKNHEAVSSVCFFMDKKIHSENANKSYEIMLKVIDKLTQHLHVKVYNQNQSLLTLEDITLIRKKLLQIND
ncbi:MAG: hypothetical protein ISR69_05250 [Gammaproteobacteria bacterium]|nr:hypothetical protein [Gammaproteobacteria bacterium]